VEAPGIQFGAQPVRGHLGKTLAHFTKRFAEKTKGLTSMPDPYFFIFGGASGIRTPDLRIMIPSL
jgi:hypothetical protein